MDDNDSRQRRKGAISRGVDFSNNVATGIKLGRFAVAAVNPATITWIVGGTIALIVVLFLINIFTLTGGGAAGIPGTGGENAGQATGATPVGTNGSPIVISGTGEACVTPFEGRHFCSVDNLLKYFNGDRDKAIVASLVCESESGSNDLIPPNTNCGTNDYSVGLFQINAVGNCSGAYGPGRWGTQSCENLLSSSIRDACVQSWQDEYQNIQMMLRISNNGIHWSFWGTWNHPGKTPFPISALLTQCGISF